MNVIGVWLKVGCVPDLIFPISPLPDAVFTLGLVAGAIGRAGVQRVDGEEVAPHAVLVRR